MDNEIYYNDRQVLVAIVRSLKEINKTLKELAEKESKWNYEIRKLGKSYVLDFVE